MGFAKNLAQMGASFIPGVGPIASAAIGAIGSSGTQGKQNTSQKTSQTENVNNTSSVDMFDEAIEDPTFSQARTSLIPMLQQQMRKANQPVYGDAQKAGFLNNLNELAGGAMDSLKSQLASTGRLDSGSFASGVTDIQKERFGKASEFFGQLPMMERQAQFDQMAPLMQMGMNWFGRAPISTKRTGTTTEKGTRTSEGNMTGTTSMEGPGFLKSFAGNVAGAGLYSGAGKMPSFADMFKGKPKDTGNY